ncbi:MAG TPA: hypothetical protein DCY88_04430 [Cyanobacteria bacterium UBA11372]|nr:hypothetical protein [Cyanobacteria bacterium UBA11372]
MSKRVIFRIDNGNFEQGFSVSLEIRDHQRNLLAGEVFGTLVPNSKIPDLYQEWQKAYYAWGQDENCHWWRRQIDVPLMTTNYSSSEDNVNRLKNAADEFQTAFNNWLSFTLLEDIIWTLAQNVKENEPVTFIVQTDNPELQKLPWDIWSISKRFDYFQVALSSKKTPIKGEMSFYVKILVILGSDENIDIKTDWQTLQNKLKPGAKLTLLEKPKVDEIKEKLRNQSWDILFFAGHSATNSDVNDARIWLDDQTSLSLKDKDIERDLQKAIRKGLKLAIFNSCDGLGLARQLDNLGMPHIIVMREPVHDRVAQKFLEHFLTSFAKGESLHKAVCEARENLIDIEKNSPNASWLPVIFQNPEEPPLFYRIKNYQLMLNIILCGIGAIASLTLTASVPLLPSQQEACDAQLNKNLPLSCGEKALMNPKDRPPQLKKEEGIYAIAQHNYPKAVRLLTQAWQEKKDPETLIYLNNAKILAEKIPEHNIYTIPVVVPISNAPDFQSKDIVKGIAWLQDRVNKNPDNQWKIRIAIADDGNNIVQAQTIAKELVKRQDILVAIGHYSSHLTTNVKHIYQANKLVLVSGSAASQALSSTDPVNNFFFRSAQNTQSASKPLADYLIDKKYQNIAIFYTKGKAFSESFKKELKTHLARRVKIVGDFDLEEDTSKVKFNVARVKKEFKDAAIVLSPDAYTTSNEGDNQIAVIKENNGELLIAGNETVRDDKVLALGRQALRKMVVATPFYPSSSNYKQFQDFWGKTDKATWLVILAYDALQMAIHGIENQPGEPTRIGVQKALADKGFKVEGLSGRITLNVSDRRENTNTLIEPDCSSDSCYWRTIQK